jgi:hydrogenase maturation protease
MTSVIILAYGNASRQDDGVAFHIIARLRRRLGLLLPDDEVSDSFLAAHECARDYISENLAILCMHQLGPELSETLTHYDFAIFIDAHVQGTDWEVVHWQEVVPAYRPSMVSHHLKPDALLALCSSLFGHTPRGYILSVLGTSFDFGEELSATTSALAEQAVERLVAFLGTEKVWLPVQSAKP